jgi:hypothetical protein
MPVDGLEPLACAEPVFATFADGAPYAVTQNVDRFLGPLGDATWLFEGSFDRFAVNALGLDRGT